MEWRESVKNLIPPALLNRLLLSFPPLYRVGFVNYESNLHSEALLDLNEILQKAVEVPGDLIECGASRCGTSAILALWLRSRGVRKRVYACDSFSGFLPSELDRERRLGLTTATSDAFTSTNFAYVSRKIETLGLQGDVIPVKGYFQETLAGIPGPFCFGLVDCDLEESVEYCARTVFSSLAPGGWLAFDDYSSQEFRGARLATDRFVKDYGPHLQSAELRRSLYVARKSPDQGRTWALTK